MAARPSLEDDYAARLRGAVPRQAEAPLAAYLQRLAAWSARVNLTGLEGVEERVRGLVLEIAPAAPHLEGKRLLDVGSGNGSPGLVLALLRPDIDVTLLEPRAKRWAFLREAARAANAGNVTVVRARHDHYEGEPADTVTLRAVRIPLPELRGLARPGGHLWIFGEATGAPDGWEAEPLPPDLEGRARHFRRCST